MKSTKKLTLSALLAALSVALLTLGSLLQVLDISMAAIVSCFVIFLRIELGGVYPYLFWATTSLATLLLMPTSSAGVLFALLGLYPLCKAWLERLHPTLSWCLKLALAALILGGYVALAKFVFFLPDAVFTGWLLPVFLGTALLAFVLYDVAISRLIIYYSLRLRPRIAHLLK